MAESFENLDNILHDWVKDVQKSLVKALNRYKKQEEKRLGKKYGTWAVSVGIRARLNQAQN